MKRFAAALLVLISVVTHAFAEDPYEQFYEAADRALESLTEQIWSEQQQLYIYKDFADSENHYTQKAKMSGLNAENVYDMDENWQTDPWSGKSCIC